MRSLSLLISLSACSPRALVSAESGDSTREEAHVHAGDLVITEVMANPWSCPDDIAEWFEVYNASDRVIELSELTVADDAFNRTGISAFALSPGSVAMVGRGEPGQFCAAEGAPDAFFGTGVDLNNSNERVQLYDPRTGELVDSTPVFPSFIEGQSMQLRPTAFEADANDDVDAWFDEGTCATWSGNSPGVHNPPCISATEWFGADCGDAGCVVASDFEPAAPHHLTEAFSRAHSAIDEETLTPEDQIFIYRVEFGSGGIDAAAWDPGAVDWSYHLWHPASSGFDWHWMATVDVSGRRVDVREDGIGTDAESLTLDAAQAQFVGLRFSQAAAELAANGPFEIVGGGIEMRDGAGVLFLSHPGGEVAWRLEDGARLH